MALAPIGQVTQQYIVGSAANKAQRGELACYLLKAALRGPARRTSSSREGQTGQQIWHSADL
jgi:hypothetical protein